MKLPKQVKPISYEETQETLALLKILALGAQDVEQGRVRPLGDAMAEIRRRVRL